jgi:hypothetical protein
VIGKRGFSYIFILMMLSLLLLSVEKVKPLTSRIQRENEEKYFFFILREYAFACYKYKSYYGRYPVSLSQLRSFPPAPTFIRQFYKDPFFNTGDKFVDNTNFGWNLVKVSGRYGGIIGVRSKSKQKSLAGVPYLEFYYDKNLKLHGKIVKEENK